MIKRKTNHNGSKEVSEHTHTHADEETDREREQLLCNSQSSTIPITLVARLESRRKKEYYKFPMHLIENVEKCYHLAISVGIFLFLFVCKQISHGASHRFVVCSTALIKR